MQRFTQRFQAYLIDKNQANERLSDLLIELRLRGIHFNISEQDENGERFYFAKSADYPRGTIMATGRSKEELTKTLKDAIFTAFELPPRYCNPNLINLGGFLAAQETEKKTVYATT